MMSSMGGSVRGERGVSIHRGGGVLFWYLIDGNTVGL